MLFGNEDSDAAFLLISHVDTWFRELVFRIAVHKFETEGRLVKRKESEISCRPRGLANNVEPQRSLRVESPIGREKGREESVRSISWRSNDLL